MHGKKNVDPVEYPSESSFVLAVKTSEQSFKNIVRRSSDVIEKASAKDANGYLGRVVGFGFDLSSSLSEPGLKSLRTAKPSSMIKSFLSILSVVQIRRSWRGAAVARRQCGSC